MRVAFAGLGVMGYPMAGYLVDSGHDVTVYNRTAEKAEKWCMEKVTRDDIAAAAATLRHDITYFLHS